MLLGELVELALALAFFLLGRDFRDHAFGSFTLHAMPVPLCAIGDLTECKLVGSELLSSRAWLLLLGQQLVVLGLLGEELGLDVVRLLALLHLAELVSQCLAGLIWLGALFASFARFLALRNQVVEH